MSLPTESAATLVRPQSEANERLGAARPGPGRRRYFAGLLALLVLAPFPTLALESDRQQPLEIYAGGTDGSLGDGVTVLSGRVEIRQGTLHVQAEEARVEKAEGKVSTIVLIGEPARLEQEIEAQGRVQAEARTITYRVSAGKVELSGAADVTHPQYQISGEQLTYDLDKQHFEGSGDADANGDGRIRIQLEPEVAGELQGQPSGDGTEDGAMGESSGPPEGGGQDEDATEEIGEEANQDAGEVPGELPEPDLAQAGNSDTPLDADDSNASGTGSS